MLETIARYSFPYEAHIARVKLEWSGIPAYVADEHTINAYWLYSHALGGVRLQVPGPCAQDALAVLQEPAVWADGDLPSCGACGGHLELRVSGRRIAFVTFWVLGYPLWWISADWRCACCGHAGEN